MHTVLLPGTYVSTHQHAALAPPLVGRLHRPAGGERVRRVVSSRAGSYTCTALRTAVCIDSMYESVLVRAPVCLWCTRRMKNSRLLANSKKFLGERKHALLSCILSRAAAHAHTRTLSAMLVRRCGLPRAQMSYWLTQPSSSCGVCTFARVLAHGYSVNHTALALHRLPPPLDGAAAAGAAGAGGTAAGGMGVIENFVARLQGCGLDMNTEGGVVKVRGGAAWCGDLGGGSDRCAHNRAAKIQDYLYALFVANRAAGMPLLRAAPASSRAPSCAVWTFHNEYYPRSAHVKNALCHRSCYCCNDPVASGPLLHLVRHSLYSPCARSRSHRIVTYLPQVSPDGLLLQCAVVADRLPYTFAEGDQHTVAGAYVGEFRSGPCLAPCVLFLGARRNG